MAIQILVNITLAFIWVLTVSELTLGNLVIGYIIGILPIFLLRRFFPGSFYLRRVYFIIVLTLVFIREMVIANLQLFKIILTPKIDIHPGFFAYPCDLEEEWEVSLLAALISLTPGTVIVAISDDTSVLYIHGIDLTDADETINDIKTNFENRIKEVANS